MDSHLSQSNNGNSAHGRSRGTERTQTSKLTDAEIDRRKDGWVILFAACGHGVYYRWKQSLKPM